MVEQYQKDSSGKMVKVGEITRDMSLIIIPNFSNTPPILATNKGRDIFACAGTELNYQFNTNDYDQKDTVRISAMFAIDGATFSATNHLRLNRGTFKWKPELKDTGTKPYRLYITAYDDIAPVNGVTQEVYNIYVVKQPDIDIKITKNGCGDYNLSAVKDTTQIISYKWFVNDSVVSTSKQTNIQLNKNGKYYIKLEAMSKGCLLSGRDSILIGYWKNLEAGKDTVICAGYTLQLNPSASQDFIYLWQGLKLSDANAANPVAVPDSSTIYTVKAIDKKYGCEYFDTVAVTVSDLTIKAGNDTLACAMQAITLNVTGPKDASYVWMAEGKIIDSTASLNIITPAKTTTYKVTAKNKSGCERSDSITVNIMRSLANAGENNQICTGDSVLLNGSGGYNYYWTDTAGNILSNSASFYTKPEKSSRFILYTTDSLRCNTNSDTVEINIANTGAEIMPDTTICAGDVIKIWAKGGNTYMWFPENTLSGNNLSEPTIFPSQNTTYYVQISDTVSGCSVTKSINISVDNDCVWPGDANKDKYVNFKDVLYLGVGFNSNGNTRTNASADWKPQHTLNWADSLISGTNYKHFDANGNGKIEFNDLATVQTNYFLSHNYTPVPYIEPFSGIPLYVNIDKDTFYAGDTVKAQFVLGDQSNFPNNLYGAGFQYKIFSNVINQGSEEITFGNNYFTNTASGKLTNYKITDLVGEMSVVRTNQTNTAGFGEISTLQFVLKDSFYNYSPLGEKLLLKPIDILVIDRLGKPIDVVLKSDSAIVFRKRKVYVPEQKIVPSFKIYPNPTQTYITLESTIDLNTEIYFTNALGQVLGKEVASNEKIKTIDLSMLRAGVYMIHFNYENKLITHKIIICK